MFGLVKQIHIATKAEVILDKELFYKVNKAERDLLSQIAKRISKAGGNEYVVAATFMMGHIAALEVNPKSTKFVKEKIDIILNFDSRISAMLPQLLVEVDALWVKHGINQPQPNFSQKTAPQSIPEYQVDDGQVLSRENEKIEKPSVERVKSRAEPGNQMTVNEIARVQSYLRRAIANERIEIAPAVRPGDPVEVSIAGEFIGVLYRDDDEGEISYALVVSILEEDV